jgi:glycosyltransferase involved in cell wall biosynthesis
VVPTYNVERTIAETLATLTAQSVPPARILVADDETPDASAEIAAGFPEVEVRHFPHSGLSGVQNLALAEVQADAVAFVDADDLWHPETGRLLLAAIAATDAAAVSVNFEPFRDGSPPELADPLPPVWDEIAYPDLVRTNLLRKAGTMYRTAALRDVGGWREELPITGDHDIALRLMEAGHSIFTTSWRGLGYRLAASSMSRDPAPTLTEQLEVALPRCAGAGGGEGTTARGHARTLWLRTLARASQDHRDLRDVPALTGLTSQVPPGQRGLEALVRSPLRHGIAAGWRAWRSR